MDNLSESASIGVSALALCMASSICVYQISIYCKNWLYPAAQRLCIVLFVMPILMGWTAWINIVTSHDIHLLDFLIAFYKSIAVASFIFYIDRLIGWIEVGGSHKYSYMKVEEVLVSMKRASCYCGCFKATYLERLEDARKFRAKNLAFILQFPALLTVLGAIGLFLFYSFHKRPVLGDSRMDSYWIWVTILQLTSSTIAMNYLINYAVFASKIPELEGLSILRKFMMIKLAMLLTEFQPLAITIFAQQGLIANLDNYTVEEIVAYTNSLLFCSQMIGVGFIQYLIFPIEDYKRSPMCRRSIAIASEMGSFIPIAEGSLESLLSPT